MCTTQIGDLQMADKVNELIKQIAKLNDEEAAVFAARLEKEVSAQGD